MISHPTHHAPHMATHTHPARPGAEVRRGEWTPLDLTNLFAWWTADEGALDGSAAAVTDGEVYSWTERVSGRALLPASAGFRPTRDSDGSPTGGPVLTFTADCVRAALGTTISGFTIIYLGRMRSNGFTAGEQMYSGDGSPTFAHARNALTGTAGVHRVSGTTGNSGNLAITADAWMLSIDQCVIGAAKTARNDQQPRNMTGSPSAFEIDNIAIGNYGAIASLCPDQDVLDFIIVEGAPTRAEYAKLRGWAAKRLGLDFSEESRFRDTFARGDTSDNNLGLSDTGHAYQITGSGLANARILDGGWTVVQGSGSPQWSTAYVWPQINFVPRRVSLDFDIINYGGAGGVSSNVIGLTKNQQDLSDMIHLLIGPRGWRLERFYPAGGVPVVVQQRTTGAFEELTGSYEVEFDFTAGVITITDPTDTVTVCDWDAEIPSSPLTNYATEWLFFEIIAPLDPTEVMRMSNPRAT